MARDFDGSTDRIDYANVWNPAGQNQTISMWIYFDVNNVTSYLLMQHQVGDAAIGGILLYLNGADTAGQISFSGRHATENIYRESAAAVFTTGSWIHLLVTWDGGLDFTGIHIYKNGTEVSYATEVNGVGATVAGGGTHSIGGRIYDDTRNFDGRVASPGWWNRALGTGEIAQLADAYEPQCIPNGLIFAPDLIRHQRDSVSGKAGTLDGTTVVAHPRIIEEGSTRGVWAAAGGVEYDQAVSGGVTFTGGLSNTLLAYKGLTGALTFGGSLSAAASFFQQVSGGLTFVGGIIKKTSISLAGAINFTGALAGLPSITKRWFIWVTGMIASSKERRIN